MENIEIIRTGIAEFKMAKGAVILNCTGLGSCICAVFYDKELKIGAMVHIMMPESGRFKITEQEKGINKAKYADTAIELALSEMQKTGSSKTNLRAYIFGGANMFPNLFSSNSFANIGQKNIDAAEKEFLKNKIKARGENTGGNLGRTITLDIEKGIIEVKTKNGIEARYET